ncbi:MAG: DUF1499 domain-containing protein [Phenylobacterium sp.]|nr:DUF1499 domain-containing protein [Phenylobacterium sp.]
MRTMLARLALILSLLVPVWFMAAALGSKFDLWSWRIGLGVMIVQWGPRILIGTAILGLVALIVTLARAPRTGWRAALVALLIPALGLGYLLWVRGQSADIPPIHDVATNIEDPPTYSPALLAAREAEGANPVAQLSAPITSLPAYQGPRFAALQGKTLGQVGREAYPEVRTLTVAASPDQAMAAVQAEVQAQGWTLVGADAAAGTVEATAETFWFGFKDDVVVRVAPAPDGGSLIDMRSTSRVGLSDLGANAERIDDFLDDVEDRLGED